MSDDTLLKTSQCTSTLKVNTTFFAKEVFPDIEMVPHRLVVPMILVATSRDSTLPEAAEVASLLRIWLNLWVPKQDPDAQAPRDHQIAEMYKEGVAANNILRKRIDNILKAEQRKHHLEKFRSELVISKVLHEEFETILKRWVTKLPGVSEEEVFAHLGKEIFDELSRAPADPDILHFVVSKYKSL